MYGIAEWRVWTTLHAFVTNAASIPAAPRVRPLRPPLPPLPVEREFGFLKHHFGLAAIRVRGTERVRLHADLIMLARLGQR